MKGNIYFRNINIFLDVPFCIVTRKSTIFNIYIYIYIYIIFWESSGFWILMDLTIWRATYILLKAIKIYFQKYAKDKLLENIFKQIYLKAFLSE